MKTATAAATTIKPFERDAILAEKRLEFVFEYNDGADSWKEGIAFQGARLVHFLNGKVKPISLAASVKVWKRLEVKYDRATLDGSHDCKARAKWFGMIANCIR